MHLNKIPCDEAEKYEIITNKLTVYKQGTMILLRLNVTTVTNGVVSGTVPSQYRPAITALSLGMLDASGTKLWGYIQVLTTGAISMFTINSDGTVNTSPNGTVYGEVVYSLL